MKYRYISTAILASLLATLAQAQSTASSPRLVISIAIDQLRTDYLEQYASLYSTDGFKRLLSEGNVFTDGSYPFTPIDRASAVATLTTGTTPHYHGISALRWLDRKTLRPISCVDDKQHAGVYTLSNHSPQHLLTSTLGDELKISTQGKAIVYGIAPFSDAAILSAGHAADGALWIDEQNGSWCSSNYYFRSVPKWFNEFAVTNKYKGYQLSSGVNTAVTDMALECIAKTQMGTDEATDLLTLTYYAGADEKLTKRQDIYLGLDRDLGRLIKTVETSLGKSHVLFVISGTAYTLDDNSDYGKYRIPTGTFYINRTANLMNVYLSAIYGQAHYVEGYYAHQIYLNHKLLEEKRLSLNEILDRCEEFLMQNAGVRDVYTIRRLMTSADSHTEKIHHGYNTVNCGDILIEVAPGWNIQNEETHETYQHRASMAMFPIIFYGSGVKARRIAIPVSADRIVPTIAKAIRIRAPNACSAAPFDEVAP